MFFIIKNAVYTPSQKINHIIPLYSLSLNLKQGELTWQTMNIGNLNK